MKLIDTSAWISFINPNHGSHKNEELRALIQNGEAALCDLVQMELQGYKQSEAKAIQLIVDTIPKLEHSTEVWDLACQLARKCRTVGKPVPYTDILIFATAQHHDCQVLHNDKHFDLLAKIASQ